MQVGDLVELSAYGKKLNMFSYLRDKIGLLTKVNPSRDDYVVSFIGVDSSQLDSSQHHMSRKDIKKVYR